MLNTQKHKFIYDIFTYFPPIYEYFSYSFFGKLSDQDLVVFKIHNFFEYNRQLGYYKIDSKPFGHNKGLILRYDYIYDLLKLFYKENIPIIIHPSPSGYLFNSKLIQKLSKFKHLVFINSRYEGIDSRIITKFNIIQISIGDYIIYDADAATLVILGAIVRYNFVKESAKLCESLDNNLLEYDQFTYPVTYKDLTVPNVLREGNHKEIQKWQLSNALNKTKNYRYDIYLKYKKQMKTNNENTKGKSSN